MYVHPDVILDESPAISRARSNVVLSTSPNEKQTPDASHKPLFPRGCFDRMLSHAFVPSKSKQVCLPNARRTKKVEESRKPKQNMKSM